MISVFAIARSHNRLRIVAAIVLGMAIATSFLASRRQGQDFEYLYMAAVGIATGAPIYSENWQSVAFPEKCGVAPPNGFFYPPSTGFAMVPLAVLPYRAAQALWFILSVAAVVFGVRSVVRNVNREAAPETWILMAGAVLMTACMRWGMTPLQGAPFVFGLLCFFVVSLQTKNLIAAFAIAAFVTVFKFTVALPFLGLLLLHEQYATLAGAVGTGVVLNVIGFLRVGGARAFMDYRASVASLEATGRVNSPNPWDPQSSPRLDWTYLFDGLTGDVRASRVIALALSVVVIVWLLRESRRIPHPVSLAHTGLFLGALVCVSVLCVYHHQYDISPVLVPIVILWARLGEWKHHLRSPATWLMAPLFVMIAILPVALTQRVLVRAFGEHGAGLMNLAFPLATSLALVGALAFLHGIARRGALPEGSA